MFHMKKCVREFEEEILALSDLDDIRIATKAAMARLDLPHFIYAWSHSPYLDRLNMHDNSFFYSISEDFQTRYVEDDLFQHDVLIHAIRGTLSNPRLGRRTQIKWWTIPAELVSAKSVFLEEMSMSSFSAGMTRRFENYQKIFIAGASIIGQDRPASEFWHAFSRNGEDGFYVLRTYHDVFHDILRETTPASVYQREHWEIAQALHRGDAYPHNAQVQKLMTEEQAQASIASPVFEHTQSYDRIKLRGEEISFGPLQASAIRILHELSKTSSPWISERALMGMLEGNCCRFRDVFKHKNIDFLFLRERTRGIRLNT
ncbi:hypothetical protein MCP1_310033 [Candidatus Terasakiella magnetica]|nr:hypothetical protein MCP1_310033 [Candidatus Terasakiella magnetica]